MSKHINSMNRRSFLQSGAAGVAGLGMAAQAAPAGEEKVDPKKILNYQPGMQYRRLGETDMYISAISLGGLVNEPGVHEYGIDNGVNLVHMSNSYLGGRSIVDLGKVLKTKRDKVYVALKDNFFSRRDYENEDFSKLDEWLKVLNCEYVDFFMFNRHDEESARDPLILESFEKLKALGKVRYAGHTSHDRNRKATGSALKSGMFTLLNPVLNYDNLTALDSVLHEAHQKKVGVMAMKTMKGQNSLEEQCAYLKKLLANPAVTTVVKGIGSFEMFDAYKKATTET
ncbi:MAG: aldo/keto reductase, partial [Candidatus Hinthialibacter sp.]